MALRLVGNDFGDLSRLQLAQEGQSLAEAQAARNAAMAGLANFVHQRNVQQQMAQQQQNALASLAQRASEHKDALGLQKQQLKMNETYQDWAMKQPSKPVAETPEQKSARALREQYYVDQANIGEEPPDDDPNVTPEQRPLYRARALQVRSELGPKYVRALTIAGLNNAKSDTEAELKAAEKAMPGLLSTFGKGFSPEGRAAVRAAEDRRDNAKLKLDALNEKLKNAPSWSSPDLKDLIQKNPEGKLEPAFTVPDWLKRALSLPIAQGERGVMPPPSATRTVSRNPLAGLVSGTGTPPMVVSPLAGPTNAPPPMTGTNRPAMPPVVRQNGVLFRLMPNGQYEPVPAR